MFFICPVCKKKLYNEGGSLLCENGHCFDRAKSGYVNLFVGSKNAGGNHGDNKLMTQARRNFLNKGYYEPLKKLLVDTAAEFIKKESVILDCGCGEGYYTDAFETQLQNSSVAAFDISKDELKVAAKRNRNIEYAVASSFSIPASDSSTDMLFEIFSPFCKEEFLRVLKPGGIMIMAIPLENHLFGLKAAVYDKPYKNIVSDFNIDGFNFIKNNELKYTITLDNTTDIENLFKMTPYYYKTGKTEQARLNTLQTVTTEIEFSVLVYKKI